MPYVIAAFVILALVALKAYYDEKDYQIRIEREWRYRFGTMPKEDYDETRFRSLARYFEMQNPKNSIDDITWNDLNMDQLFVVLNQTCSCCGEEYLYAMLRSPFYEEEPLKEIDRLAECLTKDEKLRFKLQKTLSRIGKLYRISMYEYIHTVDEIPKENLLVRYLYPLSILVSVLLCLCKMQTIGIFLLVFFMGFNIYQYYKRKAKIDNYIQVFSYILRLLSCVEELSSIKDDSLQSYIEKAKESAQVLAAFRKGSWKLSCKKVMSGSILDSILDYLRMLFHIDLIQFNKMASELQKHPKELETLFTLTGYLDSTLAVASYRQWSAGWCKPKLHKERNYLRLKAMDLYHPLLQQPVENSIDAGRSVLLTGANASGKSTFLKTAALNAILAQTIATVHATDYEAAYYRVYSSMALRDDIVANESYYMVEIKSLKRILDAAGKDKVPVLCFVDEVLRGTNTLERIAASSRILYEITRKNILCFAATHDVELTHILEKYYDNYHFEEQVTEEDIIFDYKLKQGRAMTRNAIRLLHMLGYEPSIIEDAQNAANHFLEKGVWEKF